MSEIRKCPECDREVVISDRLANRDNDMDVGCNNHDVAKVMWPEERHE